MHRGHPLFDFEQRRKTQQRDSDLDMLLRSRDGNPLRFAQQIKFFLARHGTQPKRGGSGARAYDRLCEVLRRGRVPKKDSDVKQVLHELARLRVWLGQGGSSEECARDLIKDGLGRTRAGAAMSADWAQCLIRLYPEDAERICEYSAWRKGLRTPEEVVAQDAWKGAIHALLDLRARDGGGSHRERLNILADLWRASGQTWIANPTQFEYIDRLERESRGSDLPGYLDFVAWQRQQQLGRVAETATTGTANLRRPKL